VRCTIDLTASDSSVHVYLESQIPVLQCNETNIRKRGWLGVSVALQLVSSIYYRLQVLLVTQNSLLKRLWNMVDGQMYAMHVVYLQLFQLLLKCLGVTIHLEWFINCGLTFCQPLVEAIMKTLHTRAYTGP